MWTADQKNPTWNLNCEQKGRKVQESIQKERMYWTKDQRKNRKQSLYRTEGKFEHMMGVS